ncbi:non-ribosomal peptide synthetase, partial [Aldersonia kunmingensis]|uniref:non-ribosomal peptide synthetase n=1 Tax=Aldersonia kunmingensis TaxID=408066 RepID=UPI000A6D93FF
ASLFMVIHSALALWAARASATTDIAIGTPVAGRGEQVLDNLVGMFVNTLVLRTQVDPGKDFIDLIRTARDADLGAFGHADVPFERLVEVLDPARSQSHHPLVQLMLTFQTALGETYELPGVSAEVVEFDSGVAKFDLQLTIGEIAEGDRTALSAQFNYAIDLFDESTVAGFAERFLRVLRAVTAEPTRAVGDLDLLARAERVRVLEQWNSAGPDTAAESTLVALFDAAVARHPESLALRFGEVGLSYRELDERVNRLSRVLIDAGVGPESLVAVALPRSIDLVVALLATVKAGGGYLPVDPTYPADRIAYMLTDAAPVCVVTTSDREIDLLDGLPLVEIDRIDLSDVSPEPITEADRLAPLRPQNVAYVIYTSGSTGRPKGVPVPHRNVVKLFANTQSTFGFDHSDVWTMFHSYAFDFSVWELWGPLLNGGTLVVVDYYTSRSPEQFLDLLRRERVTVLNQTPSAFYQLAEAERFADPAALPLALRYVVFGGEALELRRLSDWYGRHPDDSPRLVNMYGITETTVHVSYRELDRATAASATSSVVGRAIPGLRVYVLDSRLQPVPVGVPGEIYVAGSQLARGYLGKPDLSAARFVADPFGSHGGALYRSGDLARWNRDGELEYLGRADDQVKVRGFRIELGEIESAVLAQDSVAQAAVIVREDTPGDQRVVAYVVPEAGAALAVEDVRTGAGELLPAYMVPSAIVLVDAIPLTANGKLDRKALPAPMLETKAYRALSTPIEEIVAGVFADVLDLPQVGADDDFFELGGNSLIATRVVSRIGAALDTEVGVRLLFEASSVEALAAQLESQAGRGGRVPLVAGVRPELVPLSFAQQRMWFLNKFDIHSAAYNLPIAIRLTGALDVEAMRLAIGDLLRRHESLRTRYPEHGGVPHQVVLPTEAVVPALDPVDVSEADLVAVVTEFVSAGFDVSERVPFRARLFRLPDASHVLAVVAHHISADGWSMQPLARDVVSAYAARSQGVEPSWAPLPVQYADFALWQREVLGSEEDRTSLLSAQAAYWRSALAGLPDELNLPSDRPRPTMQSFAGGRVSFRIDEEVQNGLEEVARANGATLFMVVHAALAVFLARMSGADDVAIGTPIAGRGEEKLDDLIGMFVNTLVLRSHVRPELSFTELLDQTRETDLGAFAHSDIPFERLVELLNPERSTARHPLFQVALSFENLPQTEAELPGLRISALDVQSDVAKFDVQLTVRDDVDAGMAAEFLYARDLFDESTMQSFADRFGLLLAAIVADPATSVGELSMLSSAEYELLTHVHGDEVMVRGLMPDDLTHGVALNPDKVAVRYEGRSISYRELDEYSSRLARVLIERGVGPETLVALAFPRSYEMVAAVWAVAKAGGAHVPVDPTYPEDRVRHMLTDSGAVQRLTLQRYVSELPEPGTWLVLDEPAIDPMLAAQSASAVTDADRLRPLRLHHPAYMIYTSGSTGLPKGVAVTHAGLGGMVAAATELYQMTSDGRFLHICSPSFDPSVLEWTAAFYVGATLVIVPADIIGGPELAALLKSERVTHTLITPAVLGTVDPAGITDLEVVSVGGDVTPPELVAKWAPGRKYFNGYGPTETTIISSYARLEPGRHITIGSPVHGMSAMVLDQRLRPVPPGVAGELYLAGGALARGYHNRPDVTAERFVPNPWGAPGARMYRTGDVVRWFAVDGVPTVADPGAARFELDYVGRSDFQVKVRGFRIELGEIDSVLTDHPGVDFAVTVGHRTVEEVQSLVSYVVAAAGHSIGVAALTDFVGERLPSYMVPSAIMVLDRIPLTPVGKLDRKALPEPVYAEAVAFRAPRTPVEHTVAEIFAEVLGVERVGLDDSFFALGGDSIVSIQLVSRARARGVLFSPRHVFERRTVAGIAEVAETTEGEAKAPAALAELPGGGVGDMPLPPIVRFMVERGGSFDRFNQTAVLELPIGIDRERLLATLAAVVDRHDMLRAKLFRDPNGAWQLETLPVGAISVADLVTHVPLDAIPGAAVSGTAARTELAVAQLDSALDRLDPANGTVLQFVWLDPGATESGRLIVAAHHLAVDGVTWRILIPDFVAAWAQVAEGRTPVLQAPATSMRRWAHALAEQARASERVAELPMWHEIVAGPDPLLGARPFDPAVDLARSVRKVKVQLPTEVTRSLLTTVPALYHGGVNDALLATLALAVMEWRARRGLTQPSTLIRLEGHGREEDAVPGSGLSRTAGWFTTLFPVRFGLAGIDID